MARGSSEVGDGRKKLRGCVGTTGERLARFVEVLNYFAVGCGLLTDDTRIVLDRYRGEISKRVLGRFVDAETLRAGHRLVEPVFVREVKLLLELLRTDPL